MPTTTRCLCLRVEGQEALAHVLDVPAPRAVAGWSLATGLMPQKINPQGFGRYEATDYDELADCPVEMGAFWSASFTARGVPHRLVANGCWPTRKESAKPKFASGTAKKSRRLPITCSC